MKLLFSLLFILSTGALSAQTKTDFNGTYAINKSKIDFGQAPDYALPTQFNVNQSGNTTTIIRTTTDGQGKLTERIYKFEGATPCDITTAAGSKIHSTIQWNNDKATFTLTAQLVAIDNQNSQNYTEVWSLTDGGKTLMIDRNVEQLGNGLKYNIKGYYDKN